MATRVRIREAGVIQVQAAADSEVEHRVVQPMARDMRTNVPVLSGALLSTIRESDRGPGRWRITIGDVAAGVDYHLYVEYGTSKMQAQPYIRPAVYRVRG